MNLKRHFWLLIFILLNSGIAYSTIIEDSIKTYVLKTTVVTGTRIESSLSNVPASISVIDMEEIQRSGEFSILSIINDKVPGVFVTERGILGYGAAQGSAGGISIRGVGGNPNTGVLVLIDGRPQFMGIFGHPFADTYLSNNIDRVEIVRGPASVLYGTNAMGGVINIITKKQSISGLSSKLNLTYGSFNTLKSEASIGYNYDKFGLFVSFNHGETKGHREYTNFNMNNGCFKLNGELNENINFSFDGNLNKFRTFDPGPAEKPLVNNWMEISRGTLGFSIENRFSAFEGGLKIYHNWGTNDVYDGWHSDDKNTNLLLYQTFKPISDNTITLGIDYKNYGGEGENPSSGFFSKMFIEGKNFVNELGFYALTQQFLFGNLIANAGIRYEKNSIFGNEIIPQFGIAYHITKSSTIKSSVTKGFRSPTIKDLYLFPIRNPNLKPERLWNYELGLLSEIFDNLKLEASLFYAEGSNLIITEGVYPNMILKNSGSFIHRGIELLVKYNPTDNLYLTGSYTYLDPGNETRSNSKHKFFIESNYSINMFNFNLNLKQVSQIFGDDFNRLRLPDYTLLNAKASFNPFNSISFYVSANNLLNKNYQVIYDYPMPGRTIFTGINFNH